MYKLTVMPTEAGMQYGFIKNGDLFVLARGVADRLGYRRVNNMLRMVPKKEVLNINYLYIADREFLKGPTVRFITTRGIDAIIRKFRRRL